MRFGKNVILSILLSLVMLFSSNITVLAETQQSTITADIESTFTVSIPRSLVLEEVDGTWCCDYDIDVDAEITNSEYISVVPDGEILLKQIGSDDIPLVVTQTVVKFRDASYLEDISRFPNYTRINLDDSIPEATGRITIKDGYQLGAGIWTSSLIFDIELCNAVSYDVLDSNSAPGYYDNYGVMIATWDELEDNDILYVADNGTLIAGDNEYNTMSGQLVIPPGTTGIGSLTFDDYSQLTEVIIPDSVTGIGRNAFVRCSSISDLKVPSSVTYIGLYAFHNVPHVTYTGIAEGSPWGARSIN